MAIDYSRATMAKTILQRAADAAALAAAKDPSYSDADIVRTAEAMIQANGKDAAAVGSITWTINRVISPAPGVDVAVNSTLNTTFAGILGIGKLNISAQSVAAQPTGYETIYAVVDMSASMGLAADNAARTALNNLTAPFTPGGCMFACHQVDGWEPAGKTVYQMARENNIALREDVLNAAFATFVDKFLDPSLPAVTAGQRQMSVFGFSNVAILLQAPTSSAADVKASLATFPANLRWDTYYSSLDTVLSQIGAQGDGSAANPHKTVLLITDGMSWNRENIAVYLDGAMDTAHCDRFKAAGFKLAVLDVKYQDATGEPSFDQYVSWRLPAVSPALQQCASPGLYFQANDSDMATLQQAFLNLAAGIKSQLALSK